MVRVTGVVFALAILTVGAWIWLVATSNGRQLPNCPSRLFSEQALIFDIVAICATEDVPQEALVHAANIAAEWLDNDGDGAIDEPRLIPAMQASRPYLIMTAGGPSFAMMVRLAPTFLRRVGQDLSAEETNPVAGIRDASQEEIHHLVYNSGWAVAFAGILGEQRGSVLHREWRFAEAQGYYAYNDPTCNDTCKVSEFLYVASAAYLGSQPDLATDELRLKSRSELAGGLPQIVAMIEADQYRYPRYHWPSGDYAHQENIVYAP